MVQTDCSTEASIPSLLEEAYTLLAGENLSGSLELFQKALRIDFDNEELLFALKCVNWWQNSLSGMDRDIDSIRYGDELIQYWKEFCQAVAQFGQQNNRALLAFRHFVFSKAQSCFLEFEKNHKEPDIIFRIGQTHKLLGNYQNALDSYLSILNYRKEDPALLAELADVYELTNDTVRAKAFFREAFYLNPQKIDIELIESATIRILREKIKAIGKNGIEMQEWIPVYAELWDIFSIKRELKPIEISKLRQSVYELETELKNDTNRRMILVPRLITRYFWYLDHLIMTKADKKQVDENLLKIKLLDASVYAAYIS